MRYIVITFSFFVLYAGSASAAKLELHLNRLNDYKVAYFCQELDTLTLHTVVISNTHVKDKNSAPAWWNSATLLRTSVGSDVIGLFGRSTVDPKDPNWVSVLASDIPIDSAFWESNAYSTEEIRINLANIADAEVVYVSKKGVRRSHKAKCSQKAPLLQD